MATTKKNSRQAELDALVEQQRADMTGRLPAMFAAARTARDLEVVGDDAPAAARGRRGGARRAAAAPRRHDTSYVPAGYAMQGGTFCSPDRSSRLTEEQIVAGISVAKDISLMLSDNGDFDPEGDLGQRLLATFEAFYGFPFGQQWRATLIRVLEGDAYTREALRRGSEAHTINTAPQHDAVLAEMVRDGRLLPWWRVVTDRELLVHLQRCCVGGMPAELTVEVVREMRRQVGLGGGGGRGANVKRSAKAIVDSFGRAIHVPRKSPRKKKKRKRIR